MSESISWDGDSIRQQIPAMGNLADYVYRFSGYIAGQEDITDGTPIAGDDMSESILATFAGQDDLMQQFVQLLGLASGVQGERLGVTDEINSATEETNTDSGDWTGGGGRYA